MGSCLSCIQGRGRAARSDERRPLLEAVDVPPAREQDEPDAVLAQRRVEEVVSAARELFVDLAALDGDGPGPDGALDPAPRADAELAALRAAILQRAAAVTLDLPDVQPVKSDDRKALDQSLRKLREGTGDVAEPHA